MRGADGGEESHCWAEVEAAEENILYLDKEAVRSFCLEQAVRFWSPSVTEAMGGVEKNENNKLQACL